MRSEKHYKAELSKSDFVLGGRHIARPSVALLGAIVLFATTNSFAQSTVVIGGSGKSSVEVNLDVIDPVSHAGGLGMISATGRILRMPNEKLTSSFTLRRPAGLPATMSSASASATPKLVLKPPATLVRKRKKAKAKAAKPKPVAMPAAKIAPIVAKPVQKAAPKMATAAPTQIVKPVPVAPSPPPPPPPPSVASPVVAPKPVAVPPAPAKAAPVQAAKTTPVITEPAKAKAKKKLAALPSTASLFKVGLVSRVIFTGASSRLNAANKKILRDVATEIAIKGTRLQLKAFAGGTSGSSSSASRLSLSRALAVRSFLIESGVRSTRINIRALGRSADSGPPDRVDLIILAQ